MNYCSKCGSEHLKLKIPEGDNRPRFCCDNCGVIHYQNPKMIVGCLPLFEGKILLCRRAIPPREGYWNLPAGFLENGETIQEGALREAKEEAGIDGHILRLHCMYNVPRINQVYFFFLVEVQTDALELGIETSEAMWCVPSEIPFHEMAFPSSTFAIRKYLEHKAAAPGIVHTGTWRMGGEE